MKLKTFFARSAEALIGIAVLAGAVVFYVNQGTGRSINAVKRTAAVPSVQIEKTGPVEIRNTIEGIGTGLARESVDITANATEKVVGIFFKDGQYVEGGKLLVQLNDDQYQAQLEDAKINLAEQERELRRLTPLYNARITSQKDFEAARTAVARARTTIGIVEYAIRNRQIIAPFSGKLAMRMVSLGDLVSPGTLVTSIDDISEIKIDFRVSEKYYPMVKVGQKVGVTSVAYPDTVFSGTISAISPRIDPVTRTADVRAVVKNDDRKLAPGMLFVVKLELGTRSAVMIPEKAVMSLGEVQYIFIYNKDKQNVSRRVVRLGRRDGGRVEVTGGLNAGEVIVTDGVLKLADRSPVMLKKEAAQ